MSLYADRIELGDEALKSAYQRMNYGSEGAAYGLIAVANYLAAGLMLQIEGAPMALEEKQPPRWCRIELFGHRVRYGRVGEVDFAGKRFVEVVEPEIGNPRANAEDPVLAFVEPEVFEESRRRYHPNAIYGLEEIGEEAVMTVLRRQRGLDLEPADREPDDPGDLY